MKTNILNINIDTDADELIKSHDGMILNGYSATREIRAAADGTRYTASVTHPDGSIRIEMEVGGVRWTRYPNGDIEGVRLSDGSPVNYAAAALGSIRTPRKAESSRRNGRLGGRPRKPQPEDGAQTR